MYRYCLIAICLFTAVCGARGGDIVLVRGTVSTPDAAERSYAKTVTRHLSSWLDDAGVKHAVIDDEAVEARGLDGSDVVILGYNPLPPAGEMAALKRCVEGGGRLIVFYSASTRLAKLLGLELGPYTASETDPWSVIRFDPRAAPDHCPESVSQTSRNIRPAFPAARGSVVVARWERSSGRFPAEPAVVRSKGGFWISHVLLDDGDLENKKRMLLALVGACDFSVWRAAAKAYMAGAANIGDLRGLARVSRAVRSRAKGLPGERRAAAALSRALPLGDRMETLFKEGDYPGVVETAAALRRLLVEAYGYAQSSKPGEVRGVWDRSGTGLYPGDWDRTCRILADNGITDIFPNIVWPGAAHYASDVVPRSATFKTHGDQLAKCVEAAHRRGLKVHAWKVSWNLAGASPQFVNSMKKAGRLQVSDKGKTVNWLCPSSEENLKFEKDSVREIVRKYRVDGLHLDYIRFPDSHTCFCGRCREGFEKWSGRKVKDWPADALWGKRRRPYRRWRASLITRLVRDVSAVARRASGDIKVSAAVYGKYPLCVDSIGQDWGSWLAEGYADFVVPMNYTTDTGRFAGLARAQLDLPGARGRVFPGIGVRSAGSRLGPVEVIDQVVALRDEGAGGFVLFNLNRELAFEILPVLRSGLTAPAARKNSTPNAQQPTTNVQ